MTDQAPTISLIMAVYNTAAYLDETLDSLLTQSFSDFELICVDDGSRDESFAILEKRAQSDARLRVFAAGGNMGLAAALNVALGHVRGRYVMVADSDDLYMPGMLAKRLAYLEGHPDVVAVGGGAIFMDEAGRPFGLELMPASDAALRWRMLFNSPFFHPGTLYRASVLASMPYAYDENLRSAADYDFWTRVMACGRGATQRETDLQYRIHRKSVTASRRQNQIDNRDAISGALLAKLIPGHNLSRDDIDRLRQIFINPPRSFDDPAQRSLRIPTTQDLAHYRLCLSAYCQTLSAEQAEAFVREEYHFLTPDYLACLGLDGQDFAALAQPLAFPDAGGDALFLDIDGTLLDIAQTPDDVIVPSALIGALAALAHRLGGAVALVTGRRAAEVERLFAPLQLPCAALHGAQMAGVSLPEKLRAAIKSAFDGCEAGVQIEDKGTALAIHYRAAPDLGDVLMARLQPLLQGDVQILHDRKTIEILPAGVDKGQALAALMQQPAFQGRRPIMIGDSQTDISAMQMAESMGGQGVAVGRPLGTRNPIFASPAHLRAWLHAASCLKETQQSIVK